LLDCAEARLQKRMVENTRYADFMVRRGELSFQKEMYSTAYTAGMFSLRGFSQPKSMLQKLK
jgi:hypothetical protein